MESFWGGTGMQTTVRAASMPRGVAGFASLYGATSSAKKYRDVSGSGGYRYRQYEDGYLTIMSGPTSVGTTLAPTPGVDPWQAITNEIGPYPAASGTSAAGASSAGSSRKSGGGSEGGTFWSSLWESVSPYAEEYVPGLVEAGVSKLTQGKTLAQLQAELARKRAEYARTSDPGKKAKLAAEITALEYQIELLLSEQSAAMSAVAGGTGAQASTGTDYYAYLPYAIGGVIVLGVLGFALTRGR